VGGKLGSQVIRNVTNRNLVRTRCRSVGCAVGAGATRHSLFRGFSGIPPAPSGNLSPMAPGRSAGKFGLCRPLAGPDGPSRVTRHAALPCSGPAHRAPRSGRVGRRKDCLVTAPEAEFREETCAPVWLSAACDGDGHCPDPGGHRRWLSGGPHRPRTSRRGGFRGRRASWKPRHGRA